MFSDKKGNFENVIMLDATPVCSAKERGSERAVTSPTRAERWSKWKWLITVMVLVVLAGSGWMAYRITQDTIRDGAKGITENNKLRVHARIYSHQLGFTAEDAKVLELTLEKNGIPSHVLNHRDPNTPDAIFIGAFVDAEAARTTLSFVPYEIKYIFRPDYPEEEGGDSSGFLIGIGYMSAHYKTYRGTKSEPVKVSNEQLKYLTEPRLSDVEFQRRLREVTQF